MKRRPRRTLLLLGLLLLAGGAIINIAVAWGTLFKYRSPTERSLNSHVATRTWDRLDLPWSIQGFAWGRVEQWAVHERTYLGRPLELMSSGRNAGAIVVDSGFPCHCLRAITAYWNGSHVRTGWQRPDLWPLPDVDVLPTTVRLPGFAINTAFYAAILWGLFALAGAPFALRRRRRIERGLCVNCAYDLRGRPPDSTTCPECGTPVATMPKP